MHSNHYCFHADTHLCWYTLAAIATAAAIHIQDDQDSSRVHVERVRARQGVTLHHFSENVWEDEGKWEYQEMNRRSHRFNFI